MTLSATTIARQAAMLCSGYRVGYFTDADIERWAERQIDALDEPPLPLIELATLRGMYPIDVMNLLKSIGGTFSQETLIEAEIGFWGLLYDANKVPLERAIRSLFTMTHEERLTGQQRSTVYGLDDGYDLAVAGTYGTVAQVESEFRSFVCRYAEKLKAQEVEILGKGGM